jgi:hypothetical protein
LFFVFVGGLQSACQFVAWLGPCHEQTSRCLGRLTTLIPHLPDSAVPKHPKVLPTVAPHEIQGLGRCRNWGVCPYTLSINACCDVVVQIRQLWSVDVTLIALPRPYCRARLYSCCDFVVRIRKLWSVIDSGLVGSTRGVPREQKMLKGHLPRVIHHRVSLR